MTAKRVTVFGGSGFVGRHLVQRLAREGWRVRVAVRRPQEVPELLTSGHVGQIQLIQANVRNEASVAAAVKGSDAVINLVGLKFQAGKQKFRTVHVAGAGCVARQAAAAGATTFIHMSAMCADTESGSLFARTKGIGELAVKEAFPDAVTMRPAAIFGPDDGFTNRLAAVVRMTPVVPLIGSGKTRLQPVFVGDVVDAFVAALGNNEARGRTFDLGGPDILSLEEILRLIAGNMARPRLFVPLPFWIARAKAFFLQMPYVFLRIPSLISVDQVRRLQVDDVAGRSGEESVGTLADLGLTKLVPLGSVLPEYMVRFRKYGQYDEQPRVNTLS